MHITTIVFPALGLILLGAVLAVLVFQLQLPLSSTGLIGKNPTVSFTIYGGEINASADGFGLSAGNLTSPGPPMQFNTSDIVNVTFVNTGTMPHAFEITTQPRSGNPILFNAAIGSSSNPLPAGKNGTVIFQPSVMGHFYYICPVPGHAELGMWGNVTVTAG